jgi:Leucine-rich repeat (LRR) protein
LVSLERLDLDTNAITHLPESLSQLTNLALLDLNHNRIAEAAALRPACAVTSLQALFVGMNGLTALPDEIGRLTQLESLNLIENRLTALPPALGKLTALKYLYACYNRLTSVPDELSGLTNLQSLDLSHNELRAVFDMRHLARLEVFSVYKNCLSRVPPGLGQLTSLKRLWLGINAFHTEPPPPTSGLSTAAAATESIDEVAELRSLRVLNMRGNDIHSLPEALSRLTNLDVLSLWRNKLAGPRAIPSRCAIARLASRLIWLEA